MAETVEYRIGAQVNCSDGSCGHVSRVVLDPVARAITHIVVEPRRGDGVARLVPVESVEIAGQAVQLICTTSEFKDFEPAEEKQFLPGPRHTVTMTRIACSGGRTSASGPVVSV